jgi:hypothetical protein
MHHNERSSPNAPKSYFFVSAVSPQRLEALLPFSHKSVPLASCPRTPRCKNPWPGLAHPYLPLPTLSQRYSGIRNASARNSESVARALWRWISHARESAARRVVSAARRYGSVRVGGGRGAFDKERDGQGSVRARGSSTQHGGKEKGAVAVGGAR